MSSEKHLHLITPQGPRDIMAAGGDVRLPLTDLLKRHQLPLNTRCSGRGLCHGCAVELLDGALEKIADGTIIEADVKPKTMRACDYRIAGRKAKLAIPARSLLAYAPSVVLDFRLNVPRAHDPLWQVVEVHPHEAIAHALERRMPGRIFSGNVKPNSTDAPQFVTVEFRGDAWPITGVCDTPPQGQVGVACDIGTTTVALFLVDLHDGSVLAQAGGFNRQMHLGDDVLTRINLCLTNPQMLPQLQEAVRLRCRTLANGDEPLDRQRGSSPQRQLRLADPRS